MLNQGTIEYLSKLSYRAGAQIQYCSLPLLGIHWEDEMPNFCDLLVLTEQEQMQFWLLLDIRKRLWKGDALSEEDRSLWEEAQAQVPECPIFKRLDISEEHKRLDLEVEQETIEGLSQWAADADEVTVEEDEHGGHQVSFKFDLTKENPQK